MNSNNDFWLIDSNFVGVICFSKDRENPSKSIVYIFIEGGIIMGIHEENKPLMKTRKKFISKKRKYYGKNVEWVLQKTNLKR